MPLGTATDTAALLASEYIGDQVQSAQFTSQPEFPTGFPAEDIYNQPLRDHYELQHAQGDFFLEELQGQLEDVPSENSQSPPQHAQKDFGLEEPQGGPGDTPSEDGQSRQLELHDQYEVQHSQEDFVPEESQGAAGDILNENGQSQEESHTAGDEQEVRLPNDQ